MATFPSYAELSFDGFAEERESALLRTEMESGPPKQAKIKSRVMIVRPVQIWLGSNADYMLFKTWFATSINEGADWFDWTDPVDGVTKSVRLFGTFSGYPINAALTAWVVRGLKLEGWNA